MIKTETDRLTQLKALRDVLAAKINDDPGARDLAQLAKQYRETLKEIEEIEGENHGEDEIEKLLNG
jgi:hypothetical protein